MSEQKDPPSSPAAPESGRVALALSPGYSVMEYAIERTLGGGGFGITYLARDLNLSLPVALKEYLPADLAVRATDGSVQSLGESAESQFRWGLERFIDEARALATFSHPNIVRVLRYFTANGTAYIVMEYQSGHSLKQWLPQHMPIGRGDLLKLILPLLDGLEMIHQAGFLHRDIKPDNIFVRGDGSPVLIDFGAARRPATGQDLTNIISPGFAPFEQYHSKGNQGPWTDLYSLAAVMYWLVSGNKPVESASRLKKDDMVPATHSDRHNLIGEPILSAIDWAMHLDEERRPQSAAEFRARLVGGGGQQGGASSSGGATIQLSRHVGRGGDFGPNLTMTVAPGSEAQRGNVVCTVLFLDIIAYSKASVSEQYDLKTRFNQLVTSKFPPDPENERITLDTGDGAAICFMGDPEYVFHSAIELRRSLTQEERLRVRMGLHIGPVRILTDLNGRGNVVGDGINAAQRVMSFADEGSLLVSRAFYDIVACLADGGERAFRHIGNQQDKHGRSHDLYEVILDDGISRLFEPTRKLSDEDAQALAEIDPADVATIEQELTHHLGPLARVLVRKVLVRATSAAQLRELLAQSIAEPHLRESFRTGTTDSRSQQHPSGRRSGSSDRSSGSTRKTGPSHVPSAPAPASDSRATPSQPTSRTGASMRPWINDDTSAQLERHLAKIVGPLARVLLKNELRRASDFASLVQALAQHIEKPEMKTQFLGAVSALRNNAVSGAAGGASSVSGTRTSQSRPHSSAPSGAASTSRNSGASRTPASRLETDRVLATVMFTDICDSSAHATRLGDRGWREVLEQHHLLVRAELARYGGREIDTAGDGFFAVFDGPARAIHCACTIREEVRKLGIAIRAGLHTGELETIGEKASGIAVHIGARIAALANANEVLVSSTVRDLTTGSSVRLSDYGSYELKGIPGRWQLFVAE